ncbi:MAG: tRNA (guanosine(37)-N1)-methyltransferase TrmD [Patescibacteria group bacterium]|nr:MAG: tRNA (guanosine(37)-N1)-methyltransferase TrmD [Patescibacteria group bacterium]
MKSPLRFDILTIFPGMLSSYLDESMIKRAKAQKLLDIRVHDLRAWAKDKHRKVDDRPFGGGAGMLMKVGPIYAALKELKALKSSKKNRPYVILLSPRGTRFTQRVAERLVKHKQIVFICGRYEGIDQRVTDHLVDEEMSVGDYVLTGGELPAMTILDAVARLVPGVVGKEASIVEESHSADGFIEHPHYTRPEVFSPKKGVKWEVPSVLLSGDHKKIAEWRAKHAKRAKK